MEEERGLIECISSQMNDKVFIDSKSNQCSQQFQPQDLSKQQKTMEISEEINKESNMQKSSLDEIKAVEQQSTEKSESEQYWQSKKNVFLEELNKLLIQGINQSESQLYEMSIESLKLKISELNDAISDQSKRDLIHDLEKKLIKESCIWLVEGKNGQEFDLIKLSTIIKEFADNQFQQIPSILQKNIDYYRDIIVESAEKKNYGLKLTKDIQTSLSKYQNSGQSDQEMEVNTALKIGLHEVWEIKEIQQLCNNAKIEDIDFIRKTRRQHSALLKSLEKLIKAIEKGKGEDEAFSAYQKLVINPPKMKVQTKINGKGNSQKATFDKSIEENLKKMKIDSGNTTPIKQENEGEEEINSQEVKPKKKVQKKTASKRSKNSKARTEMNEENILNSNYLEQDITNKSNQSISVNNSMNPEQEKQINQKNNQSEQKKSYVQTITPNNQKDNNQKNLFSFFKKNNNNNQNTETGLNSSNQSQSLLFNKENPENISNSINQEVNQCFNDTLLNESNSISNPKNVKSIFRKIGNAEPRPQHQYTSDKIRNINSTEEVFSIIKQECKEQWNLHKNRTKKAFKQNTQVQPSKGSSMSSKNTKSNNRRRILILIHDYVRQYKNTFFDQKSKIINPRNFLARDEDIIQYDMDSEDELQELNAENIENEEDDMDEEDFEDEDSGNKFVVPDGYLSDEGFDSDKEDVFNQKKLNFQNYNYAENSNKQGYIYQEKDKVGDVQNILMQYRGKKYEETETFPLCLKKKQNNYQEESAKIAASIVWTNERVKQYIRAVHGSYQSKKILLEQIQKIDIMKDVSKYRIENKFKEITQKDDKQEGEVLKRWIVHSAIIESLEFEENEMEELKKFRQDEYRNSRQIKKDEKPANSSQSQSTSLNLNSQQINSQLSQSQSQSAEQQQPKPIVGYNIFATQAPLKKNANITPIKPLITVQEEQQLEQEKPQVQKKYEMVDEGNNKQENNTEIPQQQQQQQQEEQSINSELNQNVSKEIKINKQLEDSQSNRSSACFEQKKQSRKNSSTGNENSNKSSKKSLILQTTLSFTQKKS